MFTYGPVPSRRLGRSLGVSLIPRKTCDYSCVYCQLGSTRQTRIHRESFYPREDILKEIESKLTAGAPDFITLVGDGEPTLSADLGWLVEKCKSLWPFKVAVITNGSLLFLPEVRDSLLMADVVMPSLDAGDSETFRKVNRPHPELEFEKIVAGLIEFRKGFKGDLRLEVMLVRGVNDSEASLRKIQGLARLIAPDKVDVAVPIRPPAEPWVTPLEPSAILRAQNILKSAETMLRPEKGRFEFAGFGTVREAIIGLASRHPLRWDQAKEIESAFGQPGELQNLIQKKVIIVREFGRARFVTLPNAIDS